MTPRFDAFSNLTEENTKQLLNILQSNVDITSCLVNCSNNGFCKLAPTTRKYICECKENFSGTQCQTDQRPCYRSSNKCLNNGTCINSLNYTTLTCKCPESGLYYGQYCENRRNLCENRTCSFHGYCIQSQNESLITYCKCNIGYEGDDCQLEMSSVKQVKMFQWSTTIICIVILGLTWFLFIGSDVLDYLRIGNEHIDMNEWRRAKLHGGENLNNKMSQGNKRKI